MLVLPCYYVENSHLVNQPTPPYFGFVHRLVLHRLHHFRRPFMRARLELTLCVDQSVAGMAKSFVDQFS